MIFVKVPADAARILVPSKEPLHVSPKDVRTRLGHSGGQALPHLADLYLAGCAFGFANGWMNVYQVLAGKTGNTAASSVPMTREYMYP